MWLRAVWQIPTTCHRAHACRYRRLYWLILVARCIHASEQAITSRRRCVSREKPRQTPPDRGGGAAETYRVQPGDTLDAIAQELDISIVSLQLANNITRPGELTIDMLLTIPPDAPAYGIYPAVDNPAPGQIYTVQIGETLDDIAQQFDVSLRALETVNNINPGRNALPGTAIFIPANVPAYGADDEFDPAQVLGQGGGAAGDFHVVQPRETLDTIAAFYDVATNCLAEANSITAPRLLQPGTVLVIDESCPAYTGFNTRPPLSDAISPADDSADTPADTESETGEAVPLGEREN